jgi:hypothetical protein
MNGNGLGVCGASRNLFDAKIRRRRRLPAVLALFLLALPLGAESFSERLSWSFRGTVLVFPEDNGLESDPAPVLPSAGAAAAYPLAGPLWAELSLDLYSTQYGYSETLGRAVPLALENRWTTAIGFVTGLQLLARLPLNETLGLRFYGGPAADLRLCYIAADLNGAEQEEAARHTGLVSGYFWGQGRWFLPVLGAGLDAGLSEKLALGFDLRLWFPLYRLWSGETLPPLEGWRFGGGIRLTLR